MKMHKIGKNFIYNLLYQVFSLLTPIVVTPYITRVFTQNILGIHTIIATISSYFCMFGTLGMPYLGTRKIATTKAQDEDVEFVFWRLYRLQVSSYAIAFACYIVYCFLFDGHTVLRILYGLQLVAYCLDISWFYQGVEEFKYISLRNILIRILSTVAILLLVKNDIHMYVLCLLLPQVLMNVGMWITVFKRFKFKIKAVPFDMELFKQLLVLAVPTIAISVYALLNKSILGAFRSSEEVAIYEQGQALIRVVLAIVPAFSSVVMPRMASLFSMNDMKNINNMLSKSTTFVWYISFGLSFGLVALADAFISWYLPQSYAFVAVELKICTPMILIVAAENIFGIQILMPMNKEKEYTFSLVCAAVANIVLAVLTIPHGGIMAACICVVVSEGVALIIQIIKAKKYISIKMIFSKCPIFIISGGFMLLFVKLLLSKFANYGLLGTIVTVFFGGVVYTMLSIIILKASAKKKKQRE